jgi:DNA polymerase-3 subunit delta'
MELFLSLRVLKWVSVKFNLYLLMQFSEILGQESIKKQLLKSASDNRVAHAQLFIAPEGSGALPLAIAYAQYLICNNLSENNSAENRVCNLKFDSITHPDLHFVFPTVNTEKLKKAKSGDYIKLWREFILENPYGGIDEWNEKLDVGNKQATIRVEDASDILKTLALKAVEGKFKIMLVWMAEKMNTDTANKILKILEEPTDKTVFILIAEKEEDLLQTIRSRCQVVHLQKLSENNIAEGLQKFKNIEVNLAQKIARQSQGNFAEALRILDRNEEESPFETWFVDWVRAAFRAKKNASSIKDLLIWSDTIAAIGREPQKKFLLYCISIFRQALLFNYETKSLVYFESSIGFKLENFAPFVNGNNIDDIYKELSDAIYHIERNGNPKIILTDLSIKLTRLLHRK